MLLAELCRSCAPNPIGWLTMCVGMHSAMRSLHQSYQCFCGLSDYEICGLILGADLPATNLESEAVVFGENVPNSAHPVEAASDFGHLVKRTSCSRAPGRRPFSPGSLDPTAPWRSSVLQERHTSPQLARCGRYSSSWEIPGFLI